MGKNFIIDNSFQILRTNTRLTSNVKIIFDSNSEIYLESFDTNDTLNDTKYKHFKISKDSYFEDKIPVFYDNMPTSIAFDVKFDNDNDIVYSDYSQQFDTIYYAGASNIQDNKFYTEEFEYLAPLYIKKGKIPSNFIILRVDGPCVYEKKLTDYNVSKTDRNNFRTEIINKWKCVKVFDFNYSTDIGYWMNRNFVENTRFPESPLEVDYKQGNYSRIYGIDYRTGNYTEKSLSLSETMYYEQPHFKMEEFITNLYKENEIIFPNILNFNFLFDDKPSTPNSYNKYSINRYLGFYTENMEHVTTLTPYIQREINTTEGIEIKKNIFYVGNKGVPAFNDNTWDDKKEYYVYAKKDLYRVIRIAYTGPLENKPNDGFLYKIISETDITIQDIRDSVQNTGIKVEYSDATGNIIKPNTNTNNILYIDKYIDRNGLNEMYNDIYLININNDYHILDHTQNDAGDFTYSIRCDAGFDITNNNITQWTINKLNNSTITDVQTNSVGKPIVFKIYKVKFYDIKDFDYDRVDTVYSDNEFDNKNKYNEYTEHKLYTTDYLDNSINKDFLEYKIGHEYEGKKVIVSSEYIASDELYEINKNGLTDIWRKNQSICKWGFTGSISNADYPYKLNNSKKIGGEYNRICDTSATEPSKMDKTNEYFYSVGVLSHENKCDTQSIFVETDNFKKTEFDISLYEMSNIDYFSYFFNNVRYNKEGDKEITCKYSVFINGSDFIPSYSLFRGIKYNIRKVDDIVRDSFNNITSVITDTYNSYNNYKLSVIGRFASDDNINIYLNDKYKNILISINISGSFDTQTETSMFYAIDQKITYLHTAKSYITLLNNINDITPSRRVFYHYIDADGKCTHYTNKNNYQFYSDNINSKTWTYSFPPFIIDVETADEIKTKRNSYKKSAVKGPKFNIYDKYKTNYYEIPYDKSFIKDPLARIIELNKKEIAPRPQVHGELQEYYNTIYRYSGAYEPIFKTIDLFKGYDFDFFTSNSFNINMSAGNVSSIKDDTNIEWSFKNKAIGVQNNDFCICDLYGNRNRITSSDKLIVDNFNYNIPLKSTITKIEILINRKSDRSDKVCFVFDGEINLELNGNSISNDFSNKINLNNYNASTDAFNVFSENVWRQETKIYSIINSELQIPITPDIINNEKFGISIMCQMYNDKETVIANSAYIDSVYMNVYFDIDNIDKDDVYFVEFDKNLRFDTDLKNFGMISELQCSKINEVSNILKMRNTGGEVANYPMIDEFGLQYSERFIFKSPFDSDYYIRTKTNIL